MKKILSVVLAVVLAFSLCTSVMAAPDLSAIEEKLAELGINFSVDEVMSILETITADISEEQLQGVIEDALATIGEFDITSIDTEQIPAFLDTALEQLAAMGVDVESLKAQLGDNELVNFFASIYMGGTPTPEETTEEETTEEEIPHTGSSVGGIAIFATLSLAAAAAFACTKKKD